MQIIRIVMLLLYINIVHSSALLIKGSPFPIIELSQLRKQYSSIQYLPLHRPNPFNFLQFPYSIFPAEQPNIGQFDETFITTIPNGCVCSRNGWIVFNNNIIQDFMVRDQEIAFKRTSFNNLKRISGRVAVITEHNAYCFFNWMTNVLGRLMLLQQAGIQYDWLYVPLKESFMKETLVLMGVDLEKVIEPSDDNNFIQADELVVPSLVNRVNGREFKFATYVPLWVIQNLREKFLPMIRSIDVSHMPKKIFISRKSALRRKMINEDEVFALFEQKEFRRYELEDFSILQQIALFYHADIIVAAHGAALAHIMFCKPNTHIIELLQAKPSATFWYMSQMLGLKHQCVKTGDFVAQGSGYINTIVNISVVKNIINSLEK